MQKGANAGDCRLKHFKQLMCLPSDLTLGPDQWVQKRALLTYYNIKSYKLQNIYKNGA